MAMVDDAWAVKKRMGLLECNALVGFECIVIAMCWVLVMSTWNLDQTRGT